MTRVRLAILISGTGSNMAAIIAATRRDTYPAETILVLSNRSDAKGLETAKAAGVKTATIDHRRFGKDREAFERQVDDLLREEKIELVALAGFMRILSPWMVSRWSRRMINIHPSLLPKFKGLNTHARAIKAKEQNHGCTVHWVSDGVDEGQIIDQTAIEIERNDTADSLASKVLEIEHELYPRAIVSACQSIVALRTEQT